MGSGGDRWGAVRSGGELVGSGGDRGGEMVGSGGERWGAVVSHLINLMRTTWKDLQLGTHSHKAGRWPGSRAPCVLTYYCVCVCLKLRGPDPGPARRW